MPNVLMLCKAFPPQVKGGGVESFSEQVARAYVGRGFGVTVLTQTTGDIGWQLREYPEGAIPVFNTGPGGQFLTALKMMKAVFGNTRRGNYSFVHATTWRPALTLAAARRRTPFVVSVHGREIFAVPKLMRPLMWMVLRAASVVAAVSDATRARALERLTPAVDASQWIVAGNGISYGLDGAAESPVNLGARQGGEPLRLLTLARLIERKNVQGCIRALEALKDAGYSNFEYRIAGTGPLAGELAEQVEKAGLADSVDFLGYVDNEDVAGLYKWADVFLHPQVDLDDGRDFEGFGLSIADAMSFGCLAIVGSGSGPSDFVTDRSTGLLVDGTSQRQIQHAIRAVYEDPGSFEAIASAGRAYVNSELSWDKHVGTVIAALPSGCLSTSGAMLP